MSTPYGGLGKTLKEWIFTIDHKRVGILYLIGSMAAFALAGIMALLIRIELAQLGPTITNPGTYNVWLYFHGAAMILAFQIPALTGFFANYFVPLMIGARDVAFPRLNALSVWLFWSGIVLALLTFVIPDPPDIMWTGYPPYSSTYTGGNTAFYTFTVLILGFASIAGGVNLITTIVKMRAPGMGWNQLNMFVWCILGAFIMQLIFVPVLGAAVTMVSFDKYLGTNFFTPGNGGDVLIYQNLFWFYSHPAVYIIFLPFIGIIFEIIATFARQRIFNYKVAVYGGVLGVVLISGEVWGHHLFTSGMPNWIRAGMMVSTLLISVPVGLLMISVVGTLYRGAIAYKTPMLYAAGFIFLFLIGGLTGIPRAIVSLDLNLAETHFIVAHFHYVMAVAGTFSIFGGVYYFFPKFSGKVYNETLGKVGFWIVFLGVNITFFTMFLAGLGGMPRRYFDYQMFPQLEGLHLIQTFGAVIIASGFVLIAINWIHALIAGKRASGNPWGSRSLEWYTPRTPPGHGNWGPESPTVTEDWTPYNYGEK
jgi:cytochrome c oxidase subunit 1